MNAKATAFLAVLAALLLTACAGLLGARDIELPLSTLQESLDRNFPKVNRYLALADIGVGRPTLTLQPGANRVLTVMDLSQKSRKGTLALSGALRLDTARRAVVLADPRIESLALDGAEIGSTGQAGRIGLLVAEHMLKDLILYTFTEEELKFAGTRFLPTKINTKASGLVITFEPQ